MLGRLSFILRNSGRVVIGRTASTFSRPLQLSVGTIIYLKSLQADCIEHERHHENVVYIGRTQPQKPSFTTKILRKIQTFFRFLHLVIIFAPVAILSPLFLFSATEDVWLNLLVNAIQRAGVVWIKTFQYLSHRRDIIGQKIAQKMVHLREQAPAHSFQDSQQIFRNQFGKDIYQIFDKFYSKPIASGSISQVYEAQYNGHKVAVKVQHPGIQQHIEQDIDIMFTVSKVLSLISKKLQAPVTKQALKKTLTDQLDFNIQQRNLSIFNQLFLFHHNVHFPHVLQDISGKNVLVETFIQGKPITYFYDHPHPLNQTIAMIGGMTFFQMLFKYNFIHADCHGGNIIVKISQRKSTIKDFFLDIIYRSFRFMENIGVKLSGESQIAKELYLESRKEEDYSRKRQRQLGLRVDVTLIDAGMVIQLDDNDRRNFGNFIRCIVQKQPKQCAEMIYSLSLKHDQPIANSPKKYDKYLKELQVLFSRLTQIDLKSLQGLELLKGMLQVIRNNNMKLDGQLGALITNMLILQQIAKDLHPSMNILSCAVPYFYAPQV